MATPLLPLRDIGSHFLAGECQIARFLFAFINICEEVTHFQVSLPVECPVGRNLDERENNEMAECSPLVRSRIVSARLHVPRALVWEM
jgi:hypothetical protein